MLEGTTNRAHHEMAPRSRDHRPGSPNNPSYPDTGSARYTKCTGLHDPHQKQQAGSVPIAGVASAARTIHG